MPDEITAFVINGRLQAAPKRENATWRSVRRAEPTTTL